MTLLDQPVAPLIFVCRLLIRRIVRDGGSSTGKGSVLETDAYPDSELAAAIVSDPKFRVNGRKFLRHFKGVFRSGNMEVRILPGQPASPKVRVLTLSSSRKARQWRAFAIQGSVSGIPNSKNAMPIRRKSPAPTANIPLFRRQPPETRFDHPCVPGAAEHSISASLCEARFYHSCKRRSDSLEQ
jgi:hypothetical protein